MMKLLINAPKNIKISVNLPASKSISNRALILNALSYSPYSVQNLSDCDDTKVMISAFNSKTNLFDIGAAGTAMRFLTAFLSKIVGEWTITGSERMKQRPIGILADAINKLGGKIEYLENEGYPPLRIYGSKLIGGELELEGNVSSQYISALLMIAPCMENGLTLTLKGRIISKPYIRMTLEMMKIYGVEAQWNDNVIKIAPQDYTPTVFKVESDWSAASYWYEIAALMPHSEIQLNGLCKQSLQGDSKVAYYYNQLGITTEYNHDGVKLNSHGIRTHKLVCDLTDEPDIAQTLAVTCCRMNVYFCFTGLQSLKIKETDRIEALKQELKKLGYMITDINDSILEWNGEVCNPEVVPTIDTYHDHRMAMAFAPAVLKGRELIINNPKVVTKSYPGYWDDLRTAGFTIEEIA